MATRIDRRVALDGDQRLRRARHRWTAVLIGALLFGVAVYLLAVHTRTGQRLEDAALRGATAGWEHRGEAKLQESKV